MTTNRSLRRQRGSVYVEMLFILPLMITIWLLMTFIYDAKKSAVGTQHVARECAWQFALSGCLASLPPECQVEGIRPQHGSSRADLPAQRLAEFLPPLAAELENLYGRTFEMTTEETTVRPSVLGGSTTATGRFAVMCADDPEQAWTTAEVLDAMCERHGVAAWCPPPTEVP